MSQQPTWRSIGPALAAVLLLVLPGAGLAGDGVRRGDRHHPRVPPKDPLERIEQKLDAIGAQLEALPIYVPFKVQVPGGMCDAAGGTASNPGIVIDSNGSGPFVVTSILIKRAYQNPTDFMFLSLNGLTIDGTFFETRTGNLFDPLFGEFAVEQSADILGMPVRRGGLIQDAKPGGNVPHEVVAEGAGTEDVRVQLFCRSDLQDLQIETVVVAGWKRPGDTISVTYVADE